MIAPGSLPRILDRSSSLRIQRPSRWIALLDPPQVGPRWGGLESVSLLLYVGLVFYGITQHVPWTDEVQAWFLAGDVSLGKLLTHSLRYEGTPGLWHSLLWLLYRAHLTFTAARFVAGIIAACGIAVLLRYSPFPLLVRLLLPFSFFLAYQDAVIARSYVLFGLLGFTAAALLRGTRQRPLATAIVLGLTANISLHGLIAAIGLAIIAGRRAPALLERPTRYAARAIFAAFALLAIVSMVPARDIDFSAGNNLWRGLARIETQMGLHPAPPPAISDVSMAGLRRAPLPVHLRNAKQSAWRRLSRVLAVVTYPLSSSRVLALVLAGLVVVQAGLNRADRRLLHPESAGGPLALSGLLPWLLPLAVFSSLYTAPRHTGMLFTAFLLAAWLTWPSAASLNPGRLAVARVTAAAFALMLAPQISWTGHALLSERAQPYSPDRMTADYLKDHGVGGASAPAGFYYYSIGPLLYFDRNLYFNQPPHRYWAWSTSLRSYVSAEEVLQHHPSFIVLGGYVPGPEAEITRDWEPNTPPEAGVTRADAFLVEPYFLRRGYHEARVFCGHSWMRSSYTEQVCETVLEPDTK